MPLRELRGRAEAESATATIGTESASPIVACGGGTESASPVIACEGGTESAATFVAREGGTESASPVVACDGGTESASPIVACEGGTESALPVIALEGGTTSASPPSSATTWLSERASLAMTRARNDAKDMRGKGNDAKAEKEARGWISVLLYNC